MPAVPRYAVFGHPIAHSLSPRLHALFAAQTGLALAYVTLDATPAGFASAAREFFAGGASGANVTLPHKSAAFALADVHTPVAHRLGVANVLTLLPDGRLEADSNDGAGLLADIDANCGTDLRACEVLLLGAGGAARAAAFALLDAGVSRLAIANRTLARAQRLAAALDAPQRVRVLAWDQLASDGAFDLVVNATSAALQRAELALPASLVTARTFAYDLSYGPAAQSFIAWARAAGCRAASDGLGMLVATAAASFQRWHGVLPDAVGALRTLRDPQA